MALNKLTADALVDGTLGSNTLATASVTNDKLNSNIISSQTAIGVVDSTNDTLLIYDNSTTSLKKVALNSFLSTSDVTEGTNLYYTDERVDDRVAALIVGGNNITATYNDTAGTLTIDGGTALELYAENPSSPTAPSATGTNAVAIGSGAIASDVRAVALGLSRADGDDAVAIGIGATNLTYGARATGAIAVGSQASATALQACAVGTNATASGSRSNAFGHETDATNTESNAFGSQAQSTGVQSTAISRAYASGADSFAASITNNTATYGATGANSVAIGKTSKATSTYAVAIGSSATASGGDGAVALGSSVTSSGLGSFSAGYINMATGNYSQALGYGASTVNIYGKLAKSSGYFSNFADRQYGLLVLAGQTTDATPKALTANNSTASATNQVILPNNSAYFFSGTIIARQSAATGTDVGAWEIKGAIRREANAASTVLVKSTIDDFNVPTGWVVALTADTTNGGLAITVTGAAATNIRWVATVNTSEVTY